jgi:phage-related protein
MKRLPAAFFALPSGREPVRDWLKSLDRSDRHAIGDDIRLVEFGWPVGMPTCRALGHGLWEVRTGLSGGRIARVFFCVHGEKLVLLHGFLKTTRKTPKPDLDLARSRKAQLE